MTSSSSEMPSSVVVSRLVLWFCYLVFGFFVFALAPLMLLIFFFGGLMLILETQTAAQTVTGMEQPDTP